MMVNVVWRRSGYDQQVHAFPLGQVAEAGRSCLEAICSHTAPPAILEPTGDRPRRDACRPCLFVLGNRLADAGGDPGRYGSPAP